MINQTKIVLDMMAGILAGMEILIPKSTHQKIDEYLLGELQATVTGRGSLRWLWIMVPTIISSMNILCD
jgi:hypothetical protein